MVKKMLALAALVVALGVAAPEAQRVRYGACLRSLHELDGVTGLKVAADLVHSPRSYDKGLSVKFIARAALDAYRIDPRHVPVAQFGLSLSEHIVSVDFEI